jgi:hypothetical protein
MTDMTLMRPISSHIVHIRSKDTTQLTAGYNSHFKFLLEDPIKINQGEQINITMSSGEFPYSFYNVSSDVNNRGIIIDDGGIEFNFGEGNYSIYELRDTINAATSSIKFSATFDVKTMKLTLTNTDTVSHTINWGQSTAAKMMGFDDNPDNNDVVAAGNSTTSDFVVNMCSVHSLMVRSNIATGNVQSTTHSNSTILQKISIDQNGFGMIYLNQDDYRTTNITQQPQIDQIEIKITDQNNNLIQFNNVNYEMSLIFQVYEKVIDYKHGGSANDRRAVRRRIMNRIADAGAVAPFTPPAQEPEGEIVDNIDDTHPVVGKSDLEDKTEHTILNQLLDMQME